MLQIIASINFYNDIYLIFHCQRDGLLELLFKDQNLHCSFMLNKFTQEEINISFYVIEQFEYQEIKECFSVLIRRNERRTKKKLSRDKR